MRTFSPAQLRASREGAGLSREQLARLVDRSVFSVAGYERGAAVPSVAALVAMADALNVQTDALFVEGGAA